MSIGNGEPKASKKGKKQASAAKKAVDELDDGELDEDELDCDDLDYDDLDYEDLDEDEDFDDELDGEVETISDAAYVQHYCERLDLRRRLSAERGIVGVKTDITRIDAGGGLKGLNFLAGPAGVGKSSLAVQMGLAGMKADPRLGMIYYALDDMTRDDVGRASPYV